MLSSLRHMFRHLSTALPLLLLFGCSKEEPMSTPDAAVVDASRPDSSRPDLGIPDAGGEDSAVPDTSVPDTSVADAAIDAGVDAGADLRTWTATAVRVEHRDSERARFPSIALFAGGAGVSTWLQIDIEFNNTDIWANQYATDTSWDNEAIIDGLLGPPDNGPRLFADANGGRAIATWTQFLNTFHYAYAALYDVTGGWSTALPVSAINQMPLRPQAALVAGGGARFVYEDDQGSSVWTSRLVGPSWSTAVDIGGGMPVSNVVMTTSTVAWVRNGTELIVGGGAPVRTGNEIRALAAAGDVLVYVESNAMHDSVRAGAAGTLIGETASHAIDPSTLRFARGPNGHGIVVWRDAGGLEAALLLDDGSWGPVVPIDMTDVLPGGVAVDRLGNGMVVCTRGGSVVTAQRLFAGEWQPPEIISRPGQSGDQPDVAIDGAGNAMAVWSEKDPALIIESIFSRRYE